LQQLSLESDFRRTHKNIEPRFLNASLNFADCPVEASLGVPGKRWTILIIRDIGTCGRDRFKRLLKTLPGVLPKFPATRLKELEAEGGFIQKYVEKSKSSRRWSGGPSRGTGSTR